MTNVAFGLLRTNRLRFWPQWIVYFIGCVLFKISGRRFLPERTLRYRDLLFTADVAGNNGLAFLYEIAIARAYSFCDETELLGPGVLFDVGANCGFFTLTRCGRNNRLRAYCFEPHPQTHQRLKSNIAANKYDDRVAAIQAAVGAASGHCQLTLSTGSSMGVVAGSNMSGGQTASSLDVPLIRLDDFAADIGVMPDFLKIDVEGFELEVLKGAPNCLKTARMVLVECHSDELLAACERTLCDTGLEPLRQGNLICARKPSA